MFDLLKLSLIYMLLLIHASIGSATTKTQPNIVVSIKPFYNLVAAITKNSCHLTLLVRGNASPHEYTLKPSDLRLLAQANLIFWGGAKLEPFLVKAINKSNKSAKKPMIVNLAALPSLNLLPIRNTSNWQPHAHCAHQPNAKANFDPHFWLSIHNSTTMVHGIVATLSEGCPTNAALYQANAQDFLQQLQKLDAKLTSQLSSVQNHSYLVLHDAYQYFETNYLLSPMGALTLHPEIPPSIKHLQKIKQLMQHEQIYCLFSEPQFKPAFITTLLKNTPVKHDVLEPIGKDADLGPDGYLVLMQKIADSMSNCLQ